MLGGEPNLASFEQMGELPSSVDIVDNYICILNKCRISESLANAKHVHVDMCSRGLEAHRALENYLVPLFIKCGSIPHAQQAFGRMLCRNEHSWTSLIHGYTECGHLQHALNLYLKMQEECNCPSRYTVMSLLKACAQLMHLEVGREVHGEVVKEGYEGDVFIASALLDMYANCGSLAEAHEVFDELPVRDVAVWNALIAGYADHGLGREALCCLEQLQSEGLSLNDVTVVSSLKACTSIGDIEKGQKIFTEAVEKGFEGNSFVGNTLVDMFASCGLVAEARDVFDKVPVKSMVTWNALISGYAEHGFGEEALHCFQQLHSEGDIAPDAVTFVCCLKACGSLGAIDTGLELHAQIINQELETSVYIGSAFVDMYAKCGSLAEAQEVFSALHVQDLVSWNALIAGYAEHGPSEEALNCLQCMLLEGVVPNAGTLICCLKACGSIGAMDKGQHIHAEIAGRGLESDPFVGNMLVDMYGKSGLLAEAQNVFDKLPVQDVVSWNTLIAAYAESGLGQEALNCFQQMQLEGLSPNSDTFVSTLKACGTIGAIDLGREIHTEIAEECYERDPSISNPLIECVFISTALIDMYGKCGSMIDAQDVFDEMRTRHLVTWNALLSGYTCQGESKLALHFFERMRGNGIQPDGVTFLSVLNACCRTGSVGKGQEYFEAMSKEYGITPTIKHHNCMVDLLGRAGRIREAVSMVETMPLQPDQATWNIVLSACQNWGNMEIGRQAFEHIMTLDKESDAAFVLMSNICTGGNT